MWGLYGGMIRSEECFDDERDERHYFAMLQGLVVTKPRHLKTNPKRRKNRPQTRYVEFVIATDKTSYQRVRVFEYEKFYNIALAVQKYDTLFVVGEYVERDFRTWRSETIGPIKTMRDFRVTFMIPAFAILDPEGYRTAFLRPTDEHFFDMEPEDENDDPVDPLDFSEIPKEFEYRDPERKQSTTKKERDYAE